MRASTWIVCFLLLSGCDAFDFAIGRSSSFTAQPSALSACGSSGATVRLAWDTRPSGEQDVAIFVRQGNEEKLFAHGGPEGSQETGPWVRPNMVFTLRSRDGSRKLASLVVGFESCDPTGKNRRLGEGCSEYILLPGLTGTSACSARRSDFTPNSVKPASLGLSPGAAS
jgi:hypothetical protein